MRSKRLGQLRILAIDPTSKGFGFAVLEGPERLVDWGIKTVIGDKNSQCLKRIEEMIEYYQPSVIVVGDATGKGSRRCLRVQELIERIRELAEDKKIKTRSFSRLAIRKVFSQYGAVTKHQIAMVIADQFPEIAPRLPPVRKSWMSENDQMNIFDAVALAKTFFVDDSN